MKLHTHCISCNSELLKDLSHYEKAFLCKCLNCKLVFSRRIPTDEELVDYYRNYGINSYLSPLTIQRYNELLDKIEPYRKSNRILDIGCGKGYFLAEAKKRGWEVFGTEYSQSTYQVCVEKGIKMFWGTPKATEIEPDFFDAIISLEVIEHINYPIVELKNYNKILRNGGVIYVTTPNFNSLLRYRLKSAYNVITYPEHLTYYTPYTLADIFNRCGFKTLFIETTGISITRFRTSKGKSTQKIVSKNSDDEVIRNKIDSNLFFRSMKYFINQTLTFWGSGDTLKGWFIK